MIVKIFQMRMMTSSSVLGGGVEGEIVSMPYDP